MSYVKIGVGGPVGSGKTALIERLTRIMSKEYSICVITNDIYEGRCGISDQKFGTATGADRGCGDRWMPPYGYP